MIDHMIKTTKEWQSTSMFNKIIERGILCIEITVNDEFFAKVGDGRRSYKNLPYLFQSSFEQLTSADTSLMELIQNGLNERYTKEEVNAIEHQLMVLIQNIDLSNYAWHKMASAKITERYADYFITFLVKEKYSASYNKAGILRCRFRSGSSYVKEHLSLTWDYLTSGAVPSDGTTFTGNPFNTADFVAVWTDTASTSCEVEIWVRLTKRYSGITFTVLDESKRNGDVFYENWTLYNSAGHGSSIYTTGTGHITSSACELFGIVSHRQLDTTLADYVKQDSQSEDSWHSLTTTGFTSSSIQYRKYGSVVEITGNFRYSGTTSAFSNFATLPSGYRPKLQRQLVFPVCPVGGSGTASPNAMLQIGTDGKMSLSSNNSSTFSNNTWIFNIMFIM